MNAFIKYVLNFIIGSFIGYIIETIWCIVHWKKIESRKGLIYSTLIPIYGFATVFITVLKESFNLNNSISYFLLTYIVCAIVEYVSSIFQEKCFNTKSWDYTGMKGNINGRINMFYLIAWSMIGVLWCNTYEILINTVLKIPFINIISIILFIFLLFDCFISFVASKRQKERRQRIKAKNAFDEWLDKTYNDKRLKKVYANAVYIR